MISFNEYERLYESIKYVDPIKMPDAFSWKGDSIIAEDSFWMVFVFQTKEGTRFKSMSKEPDTFEKLVNVIRGGTEANEIAGIFIKKEDAQKLFDLLKYNKED